MVKRRALRIGLSLFAIALGAYARTGWSQPQPKLSTNNFTVEFFQGPLLAPNRVTGMGGAYAAVAEGVEGTAVSAAAPAVREPYSHVWFDHDLMLGLSFLGTLGDTDFDNRGSRPDGITRSRVGDFSQFNFGAGFQLGHVGFAGTGDIQQYKIHAERAGLSELALRIWRWKVLVGYGFFGGQLAVGGGARIAALQLAELGTIAQGREVLALTGAAPEVGAVLMLDGAPWRAAATFRATVTAEGRGGERDAMGVRRVGTLALPDRVSLPWELELGFAYQLGPRPLNPRWRNPHDEDRALRARIASDRSARQLARQAELASLPLVKRAARQAELAQREESLYHLEEQELSVLRDKQLGARQSRFANWPRERVLLLSSLLVTGPTERAISIEGFMDQRLEWVGTSVSIAPRFGMEAEPIPDRLRLRAGTYLEPSRYTDASIRQHFTFGGDLKLVPFDFWGIFKDAVWKIGAYVDLAPRYVNTGVTISPWH